MVSGLKWRFGFGWGSVSLFVAFVVISLASSGIVRWIAIVISILAFAFLAVQYKNWNTKGWRQVHGRAMQLYASIAGKETFNAKHANREFSYGHACRELGLALPVLAAHPHAEGHPRQAQAGAGSLKVYAPPSKGK
jgi:biopolymer transport protein ExbB/TolQ